MQQTKDLEKTAKSGNVPATDRAIQDALKKLQDEIDAGKAASAAAKSPLYKAQIDNAVSRLEKLAPLIAQAARDVAGKI